MFKGQGGQGGRCEVTKEDRGQITQDFPGLAEELGFHSEWEGWEEGQCKGRM